MSLSLPSILDTSDLQQEYIHKSNLLLQLQQTLNEFRNIKHLLTTIYTSTHNTDAHRGITFINHFTQDMVSDYHYLQTELERLNALLNP